MKSTFSTIFYLKRQAARKDGTVPVMGRITVDGTQTQFSCKITIDPKVWDIKSGRAIGRSAAAIEANRMLDNMRVSINKHYRAMGARTIDEGAMDEKSGMNFSEYMAILSGNTDLLEKAKLEKRIASLEGERKSFNKGKANAEFTLNGIQKEYDNNRVIIDGMTADCNKFLSLAKTDKDGNRLNLIKLDDFPSTVEKTIGKKLQEIAKNATTGGQYVRVGELYGFPIKVISETSLSSGLATIENRFVIEGHYKYTFNNGHLAMADPKAAATNFLNALEKIPGIISQRKEKNEALAKDIPQLQELAGKVWKKEDELKQLKSELSSLYRKIQLELAPPTPVSEGQEKKNDTDTVNVVQKSNISAPKGIRI